MCCDNGYFNEINLPSELESDNPVSYVLENVKMVTNKFISIKSQMRIDERRRELEKQQTAKREERKKKCEELKKEQKDATCESSSDEEGDLESKLLPLYIPPDPNPILFAVYTPANTIWLSVGGYDAGYMYEYVMFRPTPVAATLIADGDDIEIHSLCKQ